MIIPVILTGGSGTRLWPVSRKSFPKQFRIFWGEQTLFQQTVLRTQGADFDAPFIMTGEPFRFIVTDQLDMIGVHPQAICIEPEGRDTAPAILAAALSVAAQAPNRVLLIVPSDHFIPDGERFRKMILNALPQAQSGQIVTFGITPDRPETGYGYLELSHPTATGFVPLKRFVEKPDLATAKALIKTDNHLWNAGIFMFRADTILAAFQSYAPQMIDAVQSALDNAQDDLGFRRLARQPWSRVQKISIDYAIMERAQNISVQKFQGDWSDLGSWDAIWRNTKRSKRDVAVVGGATALECDNSLLYRDPEGPEVIGVGLRDTVVVATSDAVLVVDKSRTQDVTLAVDHLNSQGDVTAEQTPRYHRPWGWYETIALGDRFQVKRIVVNPGGALSLQSHHHRSEHWIVVAGTARVIIDDQDKLVTENQSVYIPLGSVHRLENPGKFPMVLIEVQTGAYLGDDDIVRYADLYNSPEREPEP